MPVHNVRNIPTTRKNAEAIVSFTRDELLLAGFSPTTTEHLANPANTEHIRRQLGKLSLHADRYSGILDDKNNLVAFMKFNVWTPGDQLDFANSTIERLALTAMTRLGNRLPSRPMGIHGLAGDNDSVSLLLDHALEVASDKPIRVAEAKETNSPTHAALLEHGFYATDKLGTVQGLPHVLYQRDASK